MAAADFQSLIDSFVAPWAKSSDCWEGGEKYGEKVLAAFEAQKAFIAKAVSMKKPNEEKVLSTPPSHRVYLFFFLS